MWENSLGGATMRRWNGNLVELVKRKPALVRFFPAHSGVDDSQGDLMVRKRKARYVDGIT